MQFVVWGLGFQLRSVDFYYLSLDFETWGVKFEVLGFGVWIFGVHGLGFQDFRCDKLDLEFGIGFEAQIPKCSSMSPKGQFRVSHYATKVAT